MAEPVIKVEGLGKKYIIGHQAKGGYKTVRDQIGDNFKTIFSKTKQMFSGQQMVEGDQVEEFWALKDVNFEVKQGDTLGIIGRNGAGKSTLLKVLSRITEPTTGKILLRGRVASLLEVGTGFHPELSGRENIFLNGAILGMSRAEIKRKFDEIVAFSGIEKFLDTPVKRYSSGMYVRLAFSVAAHLEPEILIVDEVLAVGDAEFQKKCLGKMKEVNNKDGRTVLFVSHNLAAIEQFCKRGIMLKNGQVAFMGNANEAINYYQISNDIESSFIHTESLEKAPGNENIRLLKFEVFPLIGETLSISSGIGFELQFFNQKKNINLDATFELKKMDETVVFHHGALITKDNNSAEGIYTIRGEIDKYILNAGTYKFKLIFGENQRYPLLIVDDFIKFEILNETIGSNSEVLPGLLRLNIPYKISVQPYTYAK